MPAYKNPAAITVSDCTFTFRASMLAGFPEARAFLEQLLARGGISPPVAGQYVKLVARLRKQGRLDQPDLITHNTERTAANAYHRWQAEAYHARVQPVIRAFAHDDVRAGVQWLRVGSVSPPFEGKIVPRLTSMGEIRLDPETRTASATPATIGWFPCDTWTLHVPRAECAAHQDPCINCTPIELDVAKLEVIAQAFESAWGHRNLPIVPAECFLFGEPPRDWKPEDATAPAAAGRIVALIPRGALASSISQLRGAVTDDLTSFDARLKEGADVLVISRAVLGDASFDDIALSVQSVVTETLWAQANGSVADITAEPESAQVGEA
jgi:hypothetical protein